MPQPSTENTRRAGLPLGRSFFAIQPDAIPQLTAAMRAYARGDAMPKAAPPAQAARRRAATQSNGGAVAVIPLSGMITARDSFFSLFFGGGGGLLDFRASFREAMASPEVGSIVLDIDSPGGYVDLVPETAEEIRAARGDKKIVAVANVMAASAAYWIASAADEVVVTPSGSVGSIGVYMLHNDWSGWNEKEGIDPTYVFAGAHKVDGNPDEPLSEDARADWQGEVDDLYEMFVTAVAEGRGVTADTVKADYGEGRTLLAARAVSAGLADRIGTLEEVVGELLVPGQGGAAAARIGRASAAAIAPVAEAPAEEDDTDDEDETPPAAAETETDDKPDETEDDDEDDTPEAAVTAADRRLFLEMFA